MKSLNTETFSQEILDHINTHYHIGIRAGEERTSFLDIWMVVVNNRVFARSWGLVEKSWFNTFLQSPEGSIQCGDQAIPVHGRIPADLPQIEELINTAYLAKYDSGRGSFYAQGIIKPAHMERTIELMPPVH